MLGYLQTAKEIYIGTHEYPIPNDTNTYYWSNSSLVRFATTSFDVYYKLYLDYKR